MKKPELLAPAGNLEKLRIAIHYGADAVYMGGRSYNLRSQSDNFSVEDMGPAVDYAHRHGVKTYLTVNSYPDNNDIDGLYAYLEEVAHIPFDAYIVADPGVMEMAGEISPERTIHLSTQANTTNWKSILFWEKRGVRRVNLAREMSLEGIREARRRSGIELEVFVHGAMCISYSGRCLLSSVMSGRNANIGACAHPCRWNYALVEEKRPGEYYPIGEDETGTFIFNSKDLCLLEYIPELVGSGVDSLKIEGRMKGIHYLASVIRVYREALDRYCEDPGNYLFRREWLDELCKISHRGYTAGFFLEKPGGSDHEYHSSYIRNHDFVGVVLEAGDNGTVVVEARNRFAVGERVEFIGRGMSSHVFLLERMYGEESGSGEDPPVTHANPNQRVRLQVPFPVEKYDLVRREKCLAD
ncbi:MAG: peptidase [Geobacteraceae bacterium]|nr:peptidase [Geobacteraceae bacterium]